MSRRRKDKPFKKTKMEEFMHENKEALNIPIITDPKNSVDLSKKNNLAGLPPVMSAADIEKDAKEKEKFNNSITLLDPRYTGLEPTRGLIVRIYAKVPAKSESGLYIEQPVKVPIMTHNGKGIQDYTISPYPVTDRAIIVSTPSYDTGFKTGDIVQLADIPVIAPFPGDRTVIPKFAYKHPDAPTDIIPKSVKDEHYGYYLIPSEMIIAFIEKQDRD